MTAPATFVSSKDMEVLHHESNADQDELKKKKTEEEEERQKRDIRLANELRKKRQDVRDMRKAHMEKNWIKMPKKSYTKAKFPLFEQLPMEIRNAIWEFSLEARVVEIINIGSSTYSATQLPPALRVCRDSRAAVLRYYPLCFGPNATTRVNPALDTVFLGRELLNHLPNLLKYMLPTDASNIRKLAIDRELQRNLDKRYYGNTDGSDPRVAFKERFTAIEELSLVHEILEIPLPMDMDKNDLTRWPLSLQVAAPKKVRRGKWIQKGYGVEALLDMRDASGASWKQHRRRGETGKDWTAEGWKDVFGWRAKRWT